MTALIYSPNKQCLANLTRYSRCTRRSWLFWMLKAMVKKAVEDLNAVISENKNRRQTPAEGRQVATMSALRDHAADFARTQDRVTDDEKMYSGWFVKLKTKRYQFPVNSVCQGSVGWNLYTIVWFKIGLELKCHFRELYSGHSTPSFSLNSH
jgi:hypothetical protein